MPICRDCKKNVVANYQIIRTQRKSEICICNDCMQQYRRKEVKGARDSK